MSATLKVGAVVSALGQHFPFTARKADGILEGESSAENRCLSCGSVCYRQRPWLSPVATHGI